MGMRWSELTKLQVCDVQDDNMKNNNIKLAFEHHSYIYPFKLNLQSNSLSTSFLIEKINIKELTSTFNHIIHQEIIITHPQRDIFFSLSISFQYSFINQYRQALQNRKSLDYIGETYQQHYHYFRDKFKRQHSSSTSSVITIRDILELNNYLERKIRMKDYTEFDLRLKQIQLTQNIHDKQWLELSIRCLYEFLNHQDQIAQIQDQQPQPSSNDNQIFIAILSTLEILQKFCSTSLSLTHLQIQGFTIIANIKNFIIICLSSSRNYLTQNFIEQVCLKIVGICRILIEQIKSFHLKNQQNIRNHPQQEESSNKKPFRVSQTQLALLEDTAISWIIRTNTQIKSVSSKIGNQIDSLLSIQQHFQNRNSKSISLIKVENCTILQNMLAVLNKTNNMYLIEEIIQLINKIFIQNSSFSEILFLITSCIKFQFPKILNTLQNKIKQREFHKNQFFAQNYIEYDLYDFIDKNTPIMPFKLKSVIKTYKKSDKNANLVIKNLYKMVNAFIQKFNNFKNGKIYYPKKQKINKIIDNTNEKDNNAEQMYEIDVEQQMFLMQTLERNTEESHEKMQKMNEAITHELYMQNEKLIKVNRYYESVIKEKQMMVANLFELVSSKENIKDKLQIQSKTVNFRYLRSKFKLNLIRNLELQIINTKFEDKLLKQQNRIPADLKEFEKNMKKEESIYFNQQDENHHSPFRKEDSSLFNNQFPQGRQIQTINSIYQINLLPNQELKYPSLLPQNPIKIKSSSLPNQKGSSSISNSSPFTQEHSLDPASIHHLPPPPPLIFKNSFEDHSNTALMLPPPPPLNLSPPPFSPIFQNLPIPPPLTLGFSNKSLSSPERKSRNYSSRIEQKDKVQLKTIGWNMLETSKIKNTFWQNAHHPNISNKDEIIKYFGRTENSNSLAYNFNEFNASKMKAKKSILSNDRSKNIEIILKKMKININGFQYIKQYVDTYNEDFLTEDNIGFLLNLLPTEKEKDQYLLTTKLEWLEEEEWNISDIFLNYVSKIQLYDIKLQAMLFKYEFPEQIDVFHRKINLFIDFFNQLKKDQFFHYFLQNFLSIGNFLNSKSIKGNAKGFRLESIEKSYTLIGQDQKTSLFEFVLKTMHENRSQIFESQTLKETRNVVSLSILNQDLKFFENKSQFVQECILVGEESGHTQSTKYFLKFYIETTEELAFMKTRLEQATIIFKETKEYYGQKLESEELNKFIIEFRNRINVFLSKKPFANKKNTFAH